MDPSLFAKLHGELGVGLKVATKPRPTSTKLQIPGETEAELNRALDPLIEVEKESYQDNLVPFDQYKARVKQEVLQKVLDFYIIMHEAQKLLKETLELEERQDPTIEKGAYFSCWEKTASALSEKMKDPKYAPLKEANLQSLQEIMNVPWSFMDRVYHVALQYLNDKKYEEAECIFFFLHALNEYVFEYWFGLATCLQVQQKWQKAIDAYNICLYMQPENALIFFQLSHCYFQLQNFDHCLRTLDHAIEYAESDPELLTLLEEAKMTKELLKTQK